MSDSPPEKKTRAQLDAKKRVTHRAAIDLAPRLEKELETSVDEFVKVVKNFKRRFEQCERDVWYWHRAHREMLNRVERADKLSRWLRLWQESSEESEPSEED